MHVFDRIIELEKRLGRHLVLRGIREISPHFRGRITKRALYYLLEYRDDEPGYFWRYEIINELVDCLEQGRVNVTLYEGDLQFQEVPLAELLKPKDANDDAPE